MVEDKLSAFFPPVCACFEMTAARACSSQQQASGRLSGDLGGKGVKDSVLLWLAELRPRGQAWGSYVVAAGDSTLAAIGRKLQIDQIVEARL